MNQSSKKDRDKTAFLYVRLSRDDNLEGDSYSIQNQKKLLTNAAKGKGYTKLIVFSDDGISGVTMNRPGLKEMISELEKGHASAVFVKDMSRLGRNYIEVGRLTEEFFPENDIRLIAVSDNIDTDEGESELTPIRNLFNEWYARDISKKRRMSNSIKGASGEPLGQPPYGYEKDSENSKRWVIDKEAAEVVRRIYNMSLDGYGTEQIATILSKEGILKPVFYWRNKGVNRPGKANDNEPCRWNGSTVSKILSLQEYCGDIINFKTFSKSYKNKKRLPNSDENMVIFKSVHEPIIERAIWEQIQENRGKIRKRKAKDGEKNIFSGLLKCSDCGSNLWYHFNQKNPEIKYFNCSNYKGNRGTCNATHYVRVDFLEEVVLGEIRRLTKFANQYEDNFVKTVMEFSRKTADERKQAKLKSLKSLKKRYSEIDILFTKLYEDRALGIIGEDRFLKMSSKYDDEQAELSNNLKILEAEIEKESDKSMAMDIFLGIVRKYTRAKKLSQRMISELIDHIDVYHAERIDGKQVQRLDIHYNCIGSIEIPETLPIPKSDVLIKTRKGVALSYSPQDEIVNKRASGI